MATTTNYGWTTPDNTGYVKDGALAIRTLGSAIDTTLFAIPKGGQVIQTVTATTTSSTSTTYADATNMTATITPTKSTSKVLVTINFQTLIDGRIDNSNLPWGKYAIFKGATNLSELQNLGLSATLSSGAFSTTANGFNVTLIYLDSPGTTSATTYKLQFGRGGVGGTVYINDNNSGTVTLQEVFV
jgi:hypothetical protein